MDFFKLDYKRKFPKRHENIMPCDKEEYNCIEIVFNEGYSVKYHGFNMCIGNDTSVNPSDDVLINVLENPHLFIRIIHYEEENLFKNQVTLDKIWGYEILDILKGGKSIIQVNDRSIYI